VLVVEDDPGVRELTCHVLRECGYSVLEADGAAEAVSRVERHTGPIHLVVTDVVMPGVSGRGLAEVLRADRPGLAVLFVSGYTDDEVVRRGVIQETAHFLQKPFTPSELARKVRAVLSASAPADR
jgi:CheY-like chemotaxis protein